MKRHQFAHARLLGELDRLAQSAVAPSEAFDVFRVTVLRIVNQDVRPLGQRRTGGPGGRFGKGLSPEGRFMIGQIRHDMGPFLDAEPHRRIGVAHQLGADTELPDFDFSGRDLM